MSVKFHRSKSISPTHSSSLLSVKDCGNGKRRTSLRNEIGRRSFRALHSLRTDNSKLQLLEVSSPLSVEHVGHVGFNATSGEINIKGEWTNYMSVERSDLKEQSQPMPIPTQLRKSATLPGSLSSQSGLPTPNEDNFLSLKTTGSKHKLVLRSAPSSPLHGCYKSPMSSLSSVPSSPLQRPRLSTMRGLSKSVDELHPCVQYQVHVEEPPHREDKKRTQSLAMANTVKQKLEVDSEKLQIGKERRSMSRKGSVRQANWVRRRSRSCEQERRFHDTQQLSDQDRKMSMDSILRNERKGSTHRRNRWGIVGSQEHNFLQGLSNSRDNLFASPQGEEKEENKKEATNGDQDLLRLENEQLQDECTRLRKKMQRMKEDFAEQERQVQHDHQMTCLRLERYLYQQREETLRIEFQLQSQLHETQKRLDSVLSKTEDQTYPPSIDSREINFWIVNRDEVKLGSQIGGGAWGYISKGNFRSQVVAVKLPHPQILTHHTYERLQREVSIMAKVRHPNLLLFIAAVFDEQAEELKAPPMIITELLDMDLRSAYVQKVLKPSSKLPIFRDIARALNYLHECYEPIIHRDISAPNVLLEALPDDRWKAKVSDFGSANLARWANTSGEGAIIYAAPETFPRQARSPTSPIFPQSTKIDVYSYGILLCEVITSRMPEPEQFEEMLDEVKFSWAAMNSLITSCISYNPEDRPTMAQVLVRLNTPPQPLRRKKTINY